MKAKLTLATLLIAGVVASPFAATAMGYKHTRHHHHMSTTTTGTNMKSSKSMRGSDATGQGTVSPSGNANGSTGPTKK
jgi:hypothetical protein